MKAKAINIIRFVAQAAGFLASAFFLIFLVGEGGAGLMEGKTAVVPILILMLSATAAYVLSFKKSRIGGLIMVAGGVAMAVYLLILGGVSEIKMSLIFALPFIIPGLILFFTDSKKRKN